MKWEGERSSSRGTTPCLGTFITLKCFLLLLVQLVTLSIQSKNCKCPHAMSPVKVAPKSENRNRGIRKGRKPRSILRKKNKTFHYVPYDLRLQEVWGHGLVKCWLKARTGCPVQAKHSHWNQNSRLVSFPLVQRKVDHTDVIMSAH